MTTTKVQAAVKSRGLWRKGKNQYTQGSKRTLVATGYSDCSSFVRWCWLMVMGTDIGGNTEAQVQSKNLLTTHTGGKYPDLSKLQVGDLIYFGGNSSHYLGVGHVELLITVGSTLSKCQTLGHGSGKGPTQKNLKDYCDQRGNYLMTRRPKVTQKTWKLGQRIITLYCFGEDVCAMQAGLLKLGYALGTDGANWDCNDATEAAIRAFQKNNGLAVDGQFGPKSLAKMNALLSDTTQAPASDAPLTEDDYQDPSDLPDLPDPSGDPPTDTPDTATPSTDDTIADSTPIDDNGAPDASMGSSAVNPYPKPTKNKQRGNTGAAVRWIQWELRQSGYLQVNVGGKLKTLLIDGDFGPITDAAVRAFQKAQKLAVDGIVGPKTVAALIADQGTGGQSVPGTSAPAAGDRRECPDISYYDGKPDWSLVNVPHIWIREGDSLNVRDPQFNTNVQGATKYKIAWSAYLFFRASSKYEAAKEITTFVDRVKATGATPAGYVLDVEVDSVTKAALVYAVSQLRSLLGANGPQVGIYIANQLYSKFATEVKLFDYRWVPRYNGWKTEPAHPWDVWQGGPGSFSGIRSGKKEVDCNRLKDGLTWAQLLAMRAKV